MKRRQRHFVMARVTSWDGKRGQAKTRDGLIISLHAERLRLSGTAPESVSIGARLEIEVISYAFRAWPAEGQAQARAWRRKARMRAGCKNSEKQRGEAA